LAKVTVVAASEGISMRHPGHQGVVHRTTFSEYVRSALWKQCGLLLAIFFITVPVGSSQTFATLELQHRDADELIPLIQPLLDHEAHLTGDGFRLVIRATPEMIVQVRELLKTLDSPLRDLWVSVRRAQEHRHEDTTDQIHRTREWDTETYRVRVLEGKSALIRTGTSSERALAGVVLVPWRGPVYVGGTRLEMQQGIVVSARVQADGRVRIDIREVHERERIAGSGRVEARRLATVVTGELGDWMDIGPAPQGEVMSDQRVRITTRGRSQDAFSVQVQVIEAN
jgi:hypothetical protein